MRVNLTLFAPGRAPQCNQADSLEWLREIGRAWFAVSDSSDTSMEMMSCWQARACAQARQIAAIRRSHSLCSGPKAFAWCRLMVCYPHAAYVCVSARLQMTSEAGSPGCVVGDAWTRLSEPGQSAAYPSKPL
jgi:hypothetical protein